MGSFCTVNHALSFQPLSDALPTFVHLFLREKRQTQNLQALWTDCCSLRGVILGTPQTSASRIVGSTPKDKKGKVVVFLLGFFFPPFLAAEDNRGICGRTDYAEQFVLSTS